MFGFTDLEDRLLGPDGSDALSDTLSKIRAIMNELRASLDQGLPSEDHANAKKILAAAVAAEHILMKPAKAMGT